MSTKALTRPLAHHPHDHLPAGVYDVHGRELSHRHVREAYAHQLGQHVMDLCELAQAHQDDPSHRVHDLLRDAVHGRISGVWRLEKYAEPIEWHAYRLMHNRSPHVPVTDADLEGFDFHALPESVRVAADIAMKRGCRPLIEEWREQEFENLFLQVGINALWTIAASGAGASNTGASPASATALYNNSQARIGVGDSSTAAAATQTGLQASTNKLYTAMDATYPVQSGGGGTSTTFTTNTFRCTVGSGSGNFAWNEYTADNCQGSNSTSTTQSGGSSLDRVVSASGTKASGTTWQPSLAETIA